MIICSIAPRRSCCYMRWAVMMTHWSSHAATPTIRGIKALHAMVNGKLGDRRKAKVELKAIHDALGDGSAYQFAEIHAQWGEPEEALRSRSGDRCTNWFGRRRNSRRPLAGSAPVRASLQGD